MESPEPGRRPEDAQLAVVDRGADSELTAEAELAVESELA
jgi:hypothetical protein